MNTILSDVLACDWSQASFLIFSDNVFAPLIYYSHLGPIIVSLLLGFLVLLNNPRALANRILFSITLFFSIWVYFDLILWASEQVGYIMFFWSAIVPIELLIYASCLYLVHLFANQQKDVSIGTKLAVSVFFVPIILLGHTQYNLLGFDYTNCDREAIEGPLIQYMYVIELIFLAWATVIAIRGYRKIEDVVERGKLLLVATGAILFMLFFSAGNFLVTYFFELDWSIEQYKLFGMPIFMAFIAYSIVKFKAFNAKLLAAQALVVALVVAVLSLLFLRSLDTVRIIASLTVIAVAIMGYFLIRSVKKEIEQRERIEQLAKELVATNERQEVLIHFIGHEVKGFLTKDMGAFAALAEGDFGALPDGSKPFVEHALEESRAGADSVANILKAANLKKGTVEFQHEPFDFKALAAEAAEKAKSRAGEKGLSLTFVAADASYQMVGDKAQISDHVLRNLIDNAINYTPSGSVEVSLKREGPKLVFSVTDSGVGITEEDKKRLFTEGGHGRDSQKVNAHSTGYGLYIAKQIVEAHKGSISALSEGEGKGSTFIVELPG